MISEFILNDKYRYIGHVKKEDEGGRTFNGQGIKPLKSERFVIFTSVPDEMKEQFESGKLTFGFNENVKNTILSKLNDLDNIYEFEIN